jgi:hypothetical protein
MVWTQRVQMLCPVNIDVLHTDVSYVILALAIPIGHADGIKRTALKPPLRQSLMLHSGS